MEKVLNYVAPVVEVIEVEVEKGFVSSTPGMGPSDPSDNPGGGWGN